MNAVIALCLVISSASPCAAGDDSARGRFSLFGTWSQFDTGDGDESSFELVSRFKLYSRSEDPNALEYGINLRAAAFPDTGRDERYSLYEAFVGKSFADGAFHLRVGQMWLHELGGLGAVGGVLAEYRHRRETAIGTIRAGVFGGMEPERYDFEYASDVSKVGAYVTVEGDRGREHTLGWVEVANDEITERSVVALRNFIPIGDEVFIYQVAEYDLEDPAEVGRSGLNYILGNLRFKPWRLLEVQLNYHRGRSIDARRLSEDQLAGRPLDPATYDGLLYESLGGRVTLRPLRSLRLWVGYSEDKDNRGDSTRERTNFGLSATNLFNAAIDFTASGYAIDRDDGSYDSWYASLGKSFGHRLYMSLSYNSTVSIYRYADDIDGGFIETRPESDRFSLSANYNLGRSFSLLAIAELLEHDGRDDRRLMLGITYRFRY